MSELNEAEILKAVKQVKSILEMNGCGDVFKPPIDQEVWGIYINGSIKGISIHGPDSSDWKKVLKNNPDSDNGIFSGNKKANTKNPPKDRWIGGFESFIHAYAFAELLKRVIYREHGVEMSLSGSKRTKVIFPPMLELFK